MRFNYRIEWEHTQYRRKKPPVKQWVTGEHFIGASDAHMAALRMASLGRSARVRNMRTGELEIRQH